VLLHPGDINAGIVEPVVLGLLDQTNLYRKMYVCIMNDCHKIQKGFIKETW
jgi:hypothetical protein